MNENNDINKHEPYTIEDISCISIELEDILNDIDAPECIICRLSDYEELYEDLSKNTLCKCNFYYHESCYEEWLQYKKQSKCLICEEDISTNFYIPEPEPESSLQERLQMTRREILLLRNTRIRHREPYCEDILFNIICCRTPFRQRNSCITCFFINRSKIRDASCIFLITFIFLGLVALVYLSFAAPWLFCCVN